MSGIPKFPDITDTAAPCPFCGQAPTIEPWHGGGPRKTCVSCANDDCPAGPAVVGPTRKRAIESWNQRAPRGDRALEDWRRRQEVAR